MPGARRLVGRQAFAAPCLQLSRFRRRARFRHHQRHHALAPLLVCAADDRRRVHVRVRQQRPLHLRRIDVHAAADDQILRPPLQREVAVRCALGQVAGAQPAVRREGRGRLLRLAVIALADVRAANLQLAHLPVRQRLLRLAVDDARLNSRQRQSHRAAPPFTLQRIREVHARLGHAVALQQRHLKSLLHAFKQVVRQPVGAGSHQPHVAQIAGAAFGGPVQAPVNGGHAHEDSEAP